MVPTYLEWQNALTARHGEAMQQKLLQTTVAICGLGGLGSNIACCLARAGIGKLILLDFDKVELTNLNRQQYKISQIGEAKNKALAENLAEIAPYVDVESHCVKLSAENLKTYLGKADIICEAFDDAAAKAMLVNGIFALMPQKYVVAASGMAGLASANLIRTRSVTDHFILCGDGTSDVSQQGIFPSRVLVCAAHQAHAVLRLIARIDFGKQRGSVGCPESQQM